MVISMNITTLNTIKSLSSNFCNLIPVKIKSQFTNSRNMSARNIYVSTTVSNLRPVIKAWNRSGLKPESSGNFPKLIIKMTLKTNRRIIPVRYSLMIYSD